MAARAKLGWRSVTETAVWPLFVEKISRIDQASNSI